MTQSQKKLSVLEPSGGGRLFSVNPAGSETLNDSNVETPARTGESDESRNRARWSVGVGAL